MTKTFLEYIEDIEFEGNIVSGDGFIIETGEDEGVETYIIESWNDSVLIAADRITLDILEESGLLGEAAPQDLSKTYKWNDQVQEAEYQGRKVPLGKPMAGDVKKSKVYVRKPNGKIVKVNFGDKKLSIKKHIPGRRKSFRARHNCDNPGPRWKARYWSCRAW
jgi:hypothetical protein